MSLIFHQKMITQLFWYGCASKKMVQVLAPSQCEQQSPPTEKAAEELQQS